MEKNRKCGFISLKINMLIIELNTGNQPIYSESGTKVLAFNGEIYNYLELKESCRQGIYISKQHLTQKLLQICLKSMV